MLSNARFIPLLAYALLGVAIGIVAFILWQQSTSTAQPRVSAESFNVQTGAGVGALDPPEFPCNLKYGSLVQDQFLERNANQGNKTCSHYYQDPTILNENMEVQAGPEKLLFCTADASPASVSNCFGECKSGHCLSLQSEANTINKDTFSMTNKFEKNLNQFKQQVFRNIRTTFDGPQGAAGAPAVGVQGAPITNPATTCPTANMKGVKNRIDYGLCRRGELKLYAQQITDEIKAYDKAMPAIHKHVEAQKACEDASNNGNLWENVVASKTVPQNTGTYGAFFQPQSTETRPLGQPNSEYQCWTTGRSKKVKNILDQLQAIDNKIKSNQQAIDDMKAQINTLQEGSGYAYNESFAIAEEEDGNEITVLKYKVSKLETQLDKDIDTRAALLRRLEVLTRPPPSSEEAGSL